jgi:hypothetical protein
MRSRVRIIPMIFDTSSNVSILLTMFCDAPVQPTNLKIYAANITEIQISGLAHVRFRIDGLLLETQFVVSDVVDECLLGTKFVVHNQCIWDFAYDMLNISGRDVKLCARKSSASTRRVYAADNVIIAKQSSISIPTRSPLLSLRAQLCNWMLEPQAVKGRLLVARYLVK